MKDLPQGKITLIASIDLDEDRIEVKPIISPWQDFGFFLEVCGFMACLVAKTDGKSIEECAEYAKQYIIKSASTYTSIGTDGEKITKS